MDDPGRLGRDPIVNIGNRLDLYEISGLRSQSNSLNEFLSDIGFALLYNGELGRPVWTVNHFHTYLHPELGVLVLVRDSDSRSVVIPLEHFRIRHLLPATGNAILNMMCVKGSFILFSVIATTCLLVVNLSNGLCLRLPNLPYPVSQKVAFLEKNQFNMMHYESGLEFSVFYCNYCMFRDEVTMVWFHSRRNEWDYSNVERVANLYGCDFNDSRCMIFTERLNTVLVAYRQGRPVFMKFPTIDFAPHGFNQLFHPFQVVNTGIFHVTSPGGQGWFAVFEKQIDRWIVHLFRFNPNWPRYEFVSRTPNFNPVAVLGLTDGLYHLEELEGVVNFSMSLNRDGRRGFLVFRYNVANHSWNWILNNQIIIFQAVALSSPLRTRMHIVPPPPRPPGRVP